MKIFIFFIMQFLITEVYGGSRSPAKLEDGKQSIERQEKKVDKLFIDWKTFQKDTIALAEKVKGLGPWDGIIAVARGGLIPAAILGNVLGIKRIDTICISSYSDETKKQEANAKILKEIENRPGKWLIVDDLVDTGSTAKIIKQHMPKAFIACVYAKPQGKPTVDIYEKDIPQETWIVFPWEEDF